MRSFFEASLSHAIANSAISMEMTVDDVLDTSVENPLPIQHAITYERVLPSSLLIYHTVLTALDCMEFRDKVYWTSE